MLLAADHVISIVWRCAAIVVIHTNYAFVFGHDSLFSRPLSRFLFFISPALPCCSSSFFQYFASFALCLCLSQSACSPFVFLYCWVLLQYVIFLYFCVSCVPSLDCLPHRVLLSSFLVADQCSIRSESLHSISAAAVSYANFNIQYLMANARTFNICEKRCWNLMKKKLSISLICDGKSTKDWHPTICETYVSAMFFSFYLPLSLGRSRSVSPGMDGVMFLGYRPNRQIL